jgi:F420H(2)-dependent quinone reductase
MSNYNQPIIDEFRANEGRVGGNFEGATLLLLHSTGARSGAERINRLREEDHARDPRRHPRTGGLMGVH